jgi:hypothetical protein
MTQNTPLYAAGLALLQAVLAVLSAFNVWHASPAQQTALEGIFATGFVVATLMAAWFHHDNVRAMRRRP